MPTLYDVLPLMKQEELEHNCKEMGGESFAESLDNIKTFYNLGKTIFKDNNKGYRAFCDSDVILDELINEETKIFRSIWDKYEYIPYDPSFSYKHYDFPVRAANDFPISYVHKILELANKLDMVILPIELVNLQDIIGDKYRYSSLSSAIDRGKEFCRKSGSYMYILCPLSFYNIWNEIKGTTSSTDKYYPEKFESIFLTIDLLIPAQRNLYHMIESNSDNIAGLKQNMEENINMINVKIKSIENRLTFVEDTMRIIIDKERQQESKIDDLNMKIAKLEKLVYCLLDPLVFFAKDRIDFTNIDHNTKAHIVACFGPEFPVEFFTVNGVDIIMNNKEYKAHDIVFIP